MKYRSEIDGLRAIAVVPVILFHAGFDLFSGGFIGVDVFFVISGYLITTIIINEIDEGKFSLLTFYERRARRILPALFFVVLCCIPFAWFLLLPSDMKDFAQSLVSVATFSSNILFWRESGYFGTAAELKPLLHTWSLAVEEQFYILFPLFFMAAWRFGKRVIVWTLIFSFVVSLAVAHWGAFNKPSATFYLLPTRAWELLIGSFAAFYLQCNSVNNPPWLNNLLSGVGLAAILYSVFAFDNATPFPSFYALIPTVGTILIILFALRGTWTQTLLSMKGVVGVGLISYSLYLWHQPIFAFWRHYSIFETTHPQMLIAALLCVPLAIFTFYAVEAPFRGKASIFNRKHIFYVSGSMLSIFVVVGIWGHKQLGFPTRFSEEVHNLISMAAASPLRSECHFGRNDVFKPSESCQYFGEDATWAVYGNSHGVELAYGLASALKRRDHSVYHFTISGCPASYELESEQYCESFFQSRFEFIINSKVIENVVLTFRSESSGLESAQALVHLANQLQASGKTVYLVLQAPTLPYDISKFIRRAIVTGNIVESYLSKTRTDWTYEYKDIYNSLSQLDEGVNVIDLAEVFCEEGNCYAIRNGIPLYFDDDHMSVQASYLVAEYILEIHK